MKRFIEGALFGAGILLGLTLRDIMKAADTWLSAEEERKQEERDQRLAEMIAEVQASK